MAQISEKRREELEVIIGSERVEELHSEWHYETEDEETQDWRKALTPYEEELVNIWDINYNNGLLKFLEEWKKIWA